MTQIFIRHQVVAPGTRHISLCILFSSLTSEGKLGRDTLSITFPREDSSALPHQPLPLPQGSRKTVTQRQETHTPRLFSTMMLWICSHGVAKGP